MPTPDRPPRRVPDSLQGLTTMWDKILVAVGGSAIGALSALVQMHHNRKTSAEQLAAERQIAAERLASERQIADDRVAAQREASASANAIEERRVAVEEQGSLRDSARFYREEIVERTRMIDDLEADLARARAEVRALREQAEAMRVALAAGADRIDTMDDAERARVARLVQRLLQEGPPAVAEGPAAIDIA